MRRGAALAALALLAPLALAVGSAQAAPCTLAPVLRDVSTQQGLGSQPVLVRGKEALAKLYLSLPSCAGTSSSIAVTGATLTVTAGGTSTTIRPYRPVAGAVPAPLVPRYAVAPALDAPADPTFAVPAAVLAPAATTARFTASFSATVTWSAKATSTATPVTGTTTFRTRPGSTTAITATVEKKTNALRVLFVPMGNATKSYATEFPASARTATVAGVNALSRIFPVPAGVSDLAATSSTAGVRYSIAPTLLDLSTLLRSDGKFCGSQANFDAVKAPLGQFLLSWNTANPNTPADRVIGVVSSSVSLGGSAGCADGMSAVNGAQAWVRAVPDAAGAPSPTGALMGMELGHTFGMVPATRDAFADLFHSPYTAADTSAPNRAFNTTLRSFLADDKTVMTMSGTWNNSVTLLEPADWAGILCRLGGATTADCTLSGTIGTNAGIGAEPTFVMSGTTDGHGVDGTSVVESYWSPSVPRTTPDPASAYRLVQRAGSGAVLRDDGVPVIFSGTDHHAGSPAGGTHATGVFTLAMPFNTGADRVELWHGAPGSAGATLLYARDRTAPPSVTSTSVTTTPGGDDGGGTTPTANERVDQVGTEVGNGELRGISLSGDGKYAVFGSTSDNLVEGDTNGAADVFVRDLTTGEIELVSVSSEETQAPEGAYYWADHDAAISDDGRYVAFSSFAGSLAPGDTDPNPDVFVRDRELGTTTLVSVSNSGAGTFGGYSIAPALSGDGRFVAFYSHARLVDDDDNGHADIYVHDRETGLAERVSLAFDGGEPNDRSYWGISLSDDGRFVAFSSDASNLVLGDGNGIADVFVRDRQSGTTERVSVDSEGEESAGPNYWGTFDTAISDDGTVVAFSSMANGLVPEDTNGDTDVFVRNRVSDTTTRVSTTSTGEAPPAGRAFDNPSLSADGRYIAFKGGNGLLPDSEEGIHSYIRDLTTGRLDPAIRDASSGMPDADVEDPDLSDDASTVSVTSLATDLVADGHPMGLYHGYVTTRGTTVTPPAPPPASEPLPAGQEQVTVAATDDNPEDARLDLLYRCPDGTASPVAVGLVPSEIESGSASWVTNFDSSLGCEGGDLVTRVNDGFDLASVVPAGTTPVETSGPGTPIAAITAPTATVLQFDGVALAGSGRDAEDGPLDDAALRWSVSGPGTSREGSGGHVDLLPPTGGWPAGTYTVTLTARDSTGRTGTDTAAFTVLADGDHDGLPRTADVVSCGGSTADGDPANAWADPDGDGVPSRDDYTTGGTDAVCVARTGFDAQVGLQSVTSTTAVVRVSVPYRDLKTVAGSSVAITDISGVPVSFRPTSWSVSGTVATARFDVRPISRFLIAQGMTDSLPVVTVTGSGSSAGRPWSFSGLVSYPPR